MPGEDERKKTNPDRRDMLKTMGVAAAGVVAGALTPAEAGEPPQASCGPEHNAYGAPPGDPALFTPKDQMRQWARQSLMPADVVITPGDLANFLGGPPAKRL